MLVQEVIAGVLFVVLLVLAFAVAVLLQAARVGTNLDVPRSTCSNKEGPGRAF